MVDTPVCDFIDKYIASCPLRLHMPGHKGQLFLGIENRDITEIPGADVLYHDDGILKRSQDNAAAIFGTAQTLYSTEGSSLSIRAMLYLIAQSAAAHGKPPVVAAGRNAHKVFITAAALLDLDVRWLYPEETAGLMACPLSPAHLARQLDAMPEFPTAVYITSPDYLGNTADIAGLSHVCHSRGILLAVDNAHGAYLRFLGRHPMELGADICCDSAHKTLPVLTGGGYLHISPAAPEELRCSARRAMMLFASTSPSYLILQSLDMANRYLSGEYPERLRSAAAHWEEAKNALLHAGFSLVGDEPMKLTILTKPLGYTGQELAAQLEQQGIYCEFADPDQIVFMLGLTDDGRLLNALLSTPQRTPIRTCPPPLPRPEQVLRPHAALFASTQEISLSQSTGRVMASPTVSCPPAIPIVTCGERIDEAAVKAMEYYGIEQIQVIR